MHQPETSRSFLFAPASRSELISKALTSDADSVIVDLEDSVPIGSKSLARAEVATLLDSNHSPVLVRINHPITDWFEADMEMVAATPAVVGLVVPKVETKQEIGQVVTRWERLTEAGGEARPLKILALIESCLGLHNCYEIAGASENVTGMVFSSGEDGDLMVDLGGQWDSAGRAFHYPRSKLVVETRAAGRPLPIDGVYMAFEDDAGLASECEIAKTLGFTGKMAIHPRQVRTINETFTPTETEVEYWSSLIDAFEEAASRGIGAISFRGKMVDYANVDRGKEILRRARDHQES